MTANLELNGKMPLYVIAYDASCEEEAPKSKALMMGSTVKFNAALEFPFALDCAAQKIDAYAVSKRARMNANHKGSLEI